MSSWHVKIFKNAAKEINKKKANLQELLNHLHDQVDWNEVNTLEHDIDKLWRQEEKYWGQRSRLKWLKWGDKKYKHLHAIAIQRIQDLSGSWLKGKNHIMVGILNFYSDLYTSIVTSDMNVSLLAPFTIGKVEKVVFSLGSLKAPRPDGLNGLLSPISFLQMMLSFL